MDIKSKRRHTRHTVAEWFDIEGVEPLTRWGGASAGPLLTPCEVIIEWETDHDERTGESRTGVNVRVFGYTTRKDGERAKREPVEISQISRWNDSAWPEWVRDLVTAHSPESVS